MPTGKSKLTYTSIDVGNITDPKVKKAWDIYSKARAPVMEQFKKGLASLEAHETALENALAPVLRSKGLVAQGQEIKLGFNFGKLAFAVVDPAEAAKQGKKAITI